MTEHLVWQSMCRQHETGRNAAERFVRETFDTDREIKWLPGVGEFTFHDSAWVYRIEGPLGGSWKIYNTSKSSDRAERRKQARQFTKRNSQS